MVGADLFISEQCGVNAETFSTKKDQYSFFVSPFLQL